MTVVLDPIYILNLVLCTTILVLGCLGYKRSGDKSPLYIGILPLGSSASRISHLPPSLV